MKTTLKLLALLVVIALAGTVAVLEYQRKAISAQLSTLTEGLQGVAEEPEEQEVSGEELADQIIKEVRALIDIPDDVEPTVATIIDVDVLRAKNPFYNKAENGDHLVVTTERAILYSSREKKIIDVVPVQLEPVEAAGSEE